jgi:hypothetical protein
LSHHGLAETAVRPSRPETWSMNATAREEGELNGQSDTGENTGDACHL